ncbi:MAG: NADH-quinone oxidoreductase subunit J [Aggregatilineales bacterium]
MEVALFLIVGMIAVAAAVGMLLVKQPVHSALLLITNFACVAFLYLMLDAPFLAMVQIAVYAGAIMVLFLFVIMLLGADKVAGENTHLFKQFSLVAVGVTVAFFLAVSYAFFESGSISTETTREASPMVRVLNVAPYLPAVDVYANGELISEGVQYNAAPERNEMSYIALEPGDYEIAIGGENPVLAEPFPIGTITVEPEALQTIVMYGATTVFGEGVDQIGLPQLAIFSDSLADIRNGMSRIAVFNAYSEADAINIIDVGSDFLIGANEDIQTVLADLPYGELSNMAEFGSGSLTWAFVPTSNTDDILRTTRDETGGEYELVGGTYQLMVFSERATDVEGTLEPVTVYVVNSAIPDFGSPEAIGESLFVEYALPFEVVALLLLASMVGAIVLTQRAIIKPKPGRPMRRKVSRPLTSVISSQTGTDVRTEPQNVPQLEAPETSEPAGD